MDEPTVHILSGISGRAGKYLDQVRDSVSGTFLAPTFPGSNPYETLHASGYDGTGMTAAVIDTGLLSYHPIIAEALVEQVDFTGEGPEDFSGHGTMCALIFLLAAPRARLISVKALDKTGSGAYRTLIEAVEWCAQQKVGQVSMSCGVYQSSCHGDCALCSAVRTANANGTLVIPAAGNRHGQTTCPAKLAVFYPDEGFAVGAFDMETQTVASYSGTVGHGGVVGPIYAYGLRPLGATP